MKTIGVGLLLSIFLSVTAYGQERSERLKRITRLLEVKISGEMPTWTHRSIEPIEGSDNVIIEQWELGALAVKVAITQYKNPPEADQALKDFKSQLRIEEQATTRNRGKEFRLIKETLPTLGDEGFTVDTRGSESVAFRKGIFLVHVSIARPEHANDVFFSRKFAKHVLDVLDLQ